MTTTARMTTTMTVTTTPMTTTTPEEAPEGVAAPERSLRLWSIRTRLLVWFIAFLAIAATSSVLIVREVLLRGLETRIDRELVQETRELRALASGTDPETGRPFAGRVRRIFEVYLERNIPSANEAFITFVDGEPFLRSRRVLPYRLDQDADLVARWNDLTESDRGTVETPGGSVEYLGVPLVQQGRAAGVFIVAYFKDRERAEMNSAIAGVAATGLLILLVGSLLAWRLAERILRPVKEVSRTARSISDSDLTRRIDVRGRDELAVLATTFNEMLDRLEHAFAAQKRFIDDAGHELRTPITIIRGHLETLESDPVERERSMSLVMGELSRMSRLVEDLLVLARAERPDFLDLTVVDTAELTQEVHDKARAIADRRWMIDDLARARVVADRQRLTQALLQLADNASKHTTEEDTIAIGSKIEDDQVTFWVRDTGKGVSESEKAQIFDRFERGRGARGTEGAGLGLAIVQAIARSHHGDVSVHSRNGKGATFRVTLPVDQPTPTEEVRT